MQLLKSFSDDFIGKFEGFLKLCQSGNNHFLFKNKQTWART